LHFVYSPIKRKNRAVCPGFYASEYPRRKRVCVFTGEVFIYPLFELEYKVALFVKGKEGIDFLVCLLNIHINHFEYIAAQCAGNRFLGINRFQYQSNFRPAYLIAHYAGVVMGWRQYNVVSVNNERAFLMR
jgi:hypothetical protein